MASARELVAASLLLDEWCRRSSVNRSDPMAYATIAKIVALQVAGKTIKDVRFEILSEAASDAEDIEKGKQMQRFDLVDRRTASAYPGHVIVVAGDNVRTTGELAIRGPTSSKRGGTPRSRNPSRPVGQAEGRVASCGARRSWTVAFKAGRACALDPLATLADGSNTGVPLSRNNVLQIYVTNIKLTSNFAPTISCHDTEVRMRRETKILLGVVAGIMITVVVCLALWMSSEPYQPQWEPPISAKTNE